MNQYTIYCTVEQTKKALELGAPIKTDVKCLRGHFSNDNIFEDGNLFVWKPTAEQMLGWLEEQEDIEEITILHIRAFHSWAYLVTNKRNKLVSSKNICQSRPEATLAAIDAALNYLSNKLK